MMGRAMDKVLFTLAGALVTLGVFLITVIFRVGHVSARVEELERWRISIRADMHEISDKLELVFVELKRLTTLMEERTARAKIPS